MHVCVETGHADCLAELLRFKADPNLRREDGSTPMHYAAVRGHDGCLAVLLGANADANARRIDGATPLHLAAQMGQAGCVQLLLAHGAKPNVGYPNRQQPGAGPLRSAAAVLPARTAGGDLPASIALAFLLTRLGVAQAGTVTTPLDLATTSTATKSARGKSGTVRAMKRAGGKMGSDLTEAEMLAALLPGARAVAAKSKGSGKGLAIAMGTVVAAAITMSLAQRQDVNLWPAKPFASEGLQRGNEEPGGGVGPEGSGENDGADEHGDSGEERGDDVDEDAGDGYESESVEGDAGMEEE